MWPKIDGILRFIKFASSSIFKHIKEVCVCVYLNTLKLILEYMHNILKSYYKCIKGLLYILKLLLLSLLL